MQNRTKSSPQKIPIGKLLVVEGYITNQQLYEALKEQQRKTKVRIGDTLIDIGYITQKQLEMAISKQSEEKNSEKRKPLGKVLIENEFITERQLKEALNEQHKNMNMRIGDTMVVMGMLTEEQLTGVIQKQNESKKIESIAGARGIINKHEKHINGELDRASIAHDQNEPKLEELPAQHSSISSMIGQSRHPIKVDKNFGALLRILIRKGIITKEEFLMELSKK